jgi:hypothetical protein
MSDVSPVVGYSSNDFYYTNSDYCVKQDGYYNQYENVNSDKKSANQESAYNAGDPVKFENACNANEHYATKVSYLSKQTQTMTAKYNYSLVVYNRELLRTINYLAGIGALTVYLYFNRK